MALQWHFFYCLKSDSSHSLTDCRSYFLLLAVCVAAVFVLGFIYGLFLNPVTFSMQWAPLPSFVHLTFMNARSGWAEEEK